MAKNPKTDYVANANGWIAGRRVKAGETISLTPSQARYENVSPKGGKARKPAPAPKAPVAPEKSDKEAS